MLDFACKQFDLKEILRCSLNLTKAEFKVLEFFLNHKVKKYNSNEISKSMNLDLTTIQKSLKKLYDKKIIIRSQKNSAKGGYIYYYEIENKETISKTILRTINNWINKVEIEINIWKTK